VRSDGLAAQQRDVGQQQPCHAFAFPLRGAGIVPEGGEVAGQGEDLGALVLAKGGGRVGLTFVVLLGVGVVAERLVPVGLQGGGHQAVVRVDGQVAPSGQLGGVAGAFHLGAAQPVGLGGACRQLVGDGQGDLQGHGADGLE
jgi:hypothetical protein